MINEQKLKIILTRLHRLGVDKSIVQTVYKYVKFASLSEQQNINPNYMAMRTGVPKRRLMNFLVAAVREGLFELNWDVVCHRCHDLVAHEHNYQALPETLFCKQCQADLEPVIDDNVVITVSLHPALYKQPPVISESENRLSGLPNPTTAIEMIILPAFRESFKTMSPAIRQSFKIRNMAVMFTDLKSSTRLYEMIGDIDAFQMVNDHFKIIEDCITGFDGEVIKTIGDAILAVFPEPVQALKAAITVKKLIAEYDPPVHPPSGLAIKIGISYGPALLVNLNGFTDIFGKTINLGARIVEYSDEDTVTVSQSMIENRGVLKHLHTQDIAYSLQEKNVPKLGEHESVFSLVV